MIKWGGWGIGLIGLIGPIGPIGLIGPIGHLLVDLLTRWLVGLFWGVFFVNNWWEIVFFCVVFSFLL